MSVTVEVLREITDETVEAFARLLPQLSRTARPLDRAALEAMVACGANTVLLARSGGPIVGTLTLVRFPIPSGLRARIEDVVVDESARGPEEAVRLARAAGARTVDLTSRPSRGSANRLYERLGFTARDSRVYRLTP
ncbi:GNAT family N-acetyltransferase [Amycolatopsis anabasis]|uniref:GNAT family N-acetyltransferase n=1 Tax=Amycolatopsis anabasis TaxID=1840409 RepID=UPI00131E0189|nr:GNAT family N-acetyltransferase [Amycolatopsis anabasis]